MWMCSNCCRLIPQMLEYLQVIVSWMLMDFHPLQSQSHSNISTSCCHGESPGWTQCKSYPTAIWHRKFQRGIFDSREGDARKSATKRWWHRHVASTLYSKRTPETWDPLPKWNDHPSWTQSSPVPLSQASMAMAEHGIATRPAAFLLSSHRYLQEQRTGKWAFKRVWRMFGVMVHVLNFNRILTISYWFILYL